MKRIILLSCLLLVGCSPNRDNVVSIVSSVNPDAEILVYEGQTRDHFYFVRHSDDKIVYVASRDGSVLHVKPARWISVTNTILLNQTTNR